MFVVLKMFGPVLIEVCAPYEAVTSLYGRAPGPHRRPRGSVSAHFPGISLGFSPKTSETPPAQKFTRKPEWFHAGCPVSRDKDRIRTPTEPRWRAGMYWVPPGCVPALAINSGNPIPINSGNFPN